MGQVDATPARGIAGRLNLPDGSRITDATFRRRHRIVLAAALVQTPVLFGISRLSGAESVTGATLPEIPLFEALAGVGIIVGAVVLGAVPVLPRRVRSAIAAFAFMTTAAVLAHVSGGFIEAHFLYFVGIGVVAVYEDWVPFLVAVLYVAFQHSIFGLIGGIEVYNHPAAVANPHVWGGIHAFFVLCLVGAILVNWRSLSAARDEVEAQMEAVQQAKEEVEAERETAETQRQRAEEQKQRAEEQREAAQQQREQMQRLNDRLSEEYATTIEAVAAGDLTQRLETDVDSEAMAAIADAFNEMLDTWSETVEEVQSFADDVVELSNEVAASAEEVEQASAALADSNQEIANGADKQSQTLDEINNEMTAVSSNVEEIAASAAQVTATADTAVEQGRDGEQAATEATTEIRQIQDQTTAVRDQVEELAAAVEEIGEIVTFIDDVAEQTNLLALNASIEAAHAGEEGEGFAVVADEIKSLAGDVSEATADIETRIEAIQDQTDTTVDTVAEMDDRVNRGAATVTDAAETFEQIATTIEELQQGIEQISTATDDQAQSIEEVVSMTEEVAAVSEETASETETVSTAAEEQTATLAETATNAETFAQRADELQTLLAQFETGTQEQEQEYVRS